MVADGANVSKKALTIAVRYAAVRRQFKTADNEFETQLLDYPIHQRRLMPLLAQAIAMVKLFRIFSEHFEILIYSCCIFSQGFTALRMTAMFEKLSEELENFDSSSDKEQTERVLETLKETHASSAGLKAFSTWQCLDTIDKCRQSLGGHGYSAYAGLASMYADQAVQCWWFSCFWLVLLVPFLTACCICRHMGRGQYHSVAAIGSSSYLSVRRFPERQKASFGSSIS